MKFRATITFQTAEKPEDDDEFVLDVEANSHDRACEIAVDTARKQGLVLSEINWHCSTEILLG